MSTNRFLIVLIILTFSYIVLTFQAGSYTIVAPGTARSDSVYQLSIAVSEIVKICKFNISLASSYAPDKNLSSFKLVEVQPNTIKLVQMHVPPFLGNNGHLVVRGYSGIISHDVRIVNIERGSYAVFIQTNKAKYKPGEVVKFRVICIDRLTRPAEIAQKIFVLVYNSDGYLLKHYSNVKLVQGVFRGDLQLSESPDFGDWKIKVEVGGDAVAERSFLVEKYALPLFAVRISTKTDVAVDENKLVLLISANYFYGQPVKGNLSVILNNTYSSFQAQKLPLFERNLQFEDSTTLILDLENDLKINKPAQLDGSIILHKFYVKVVAIDSMTEQKSWTETEITIHSKPYKFRLQAPKVFDDEDEISFRVRLTITDLMGSPIQDTKSPIEIVTECRGMPLGGPPPIILRTKVETSQFGKSLTINVANQNYTNCDVYAEYKGIRSYRDNIKKNDDTFSLEVLTESPEVGKKLEVKLKSRQPIEYFAYEIVSRGSIIQTDYVNVPKGEIEHIIRLDVTFLMIPKVTLYVHRIKNGFFAGQLKDILIKSEFQNSIQIKTDAEAKPGSSVRIDVDTDSDSYVGLMGLDNRILEHSAILMDDLTKENFYTKIRSFDASNIDSDSYPGHKAGLITISNVIDIGTRIGEDDFPGILPTDKKKEEFLPEEFDKPILEFPRIRKLFSESWLYMDFERVSDGHLRFNQTIPDTITSWAITGFSLNNETGLTLTENATSLKVFQDFFVSFDLPVLVKEGETFEVPIFIRNYKNTNAMTHVMIEKDEGIISFEVLKDPQTPMRSEEKLSTNVPANGIQKLTVFIKPLISGEFNVTIKALSSLSSDAMRKTLTVQSEGITFAISSSILVYLPERGMQRDEIPIDIPENAVPGSQKMEISALGDVFRPLMRSLLEIARSPYGNGEDNMRKTISNLLVLKYLKATNYNHPALESKFRGNLEQGYSYQMGFRFLDGSFGLFDKSNGQRTGDVRQTAFALWGLKLSSAYIKIDSKVFQRGLDYLKLKQDEKGVFRTMNGSEKDNIEATALSLMVFLSDSWKNAYADVISKGLQYLNDVAAQTNQSSIAFLTTSVLMIGKHENSMARFKQLVEKNSHSLKMRSYQYFWKKPDTWQSHLETTGLFLLNLFELKGDENQDLLQLSRGLIASSSEPGESFLTSIMALYSMISFIQNLELNNKSLKVTLTNGQKGIADFRVNSKNSEFLQRIEFLEENFRRIHLRCTGYGFALIDVKYKYNLVPENFRSSSRFAISTKKVKSTSVLSVFEVCLKYLDNENNHLTVMEVNLQSGFRFTERVTPQVGLTWKFKSIKAHSQGDKSEVYIENLDGKGNCLELEVLRRNNVINAKPGWIIAYDTDKQDEKSAKSFKIDDS